MQFVSAIRLPAVRIRVLFFALLLQLGSLAIPALPARADDGIFSAANAARASIDFDGRGFLVHGKRTFIASGTLHYPRVPRALWRDRLLRMKRAGFNCVETYAFWNLHEPTEGRWDFGGEKDLNAFLKLVHELGMYAIVRVGPYVCAEWDSGGYPVWLRFKPGVRVREPNAPFESAVDAWYEHVMPIVAANQIHRGGAVILVQLENEHPAGWGKEMPNSYFKHLRDKALALGLEVPHFFSGLHHGSDPAGDSAWSSSGRANPWFTTEFWPGWYDLYGPLSDARYLGFVRGTWKILAYGGNGYNFYMLHGGTNFDTWNDDEVASCYDYAGAIGQSGDLRPIYYAFKQAALFAHSFSDILENSDNSTDQFRSSATSPELKVTARSGPAGSILFLDNPGAGPVETRVRLTNGHEFPSRPITVVAGEIRPIVKDFALTPRVRLDACSARILGIARHNDVTTLFVYGTPGRSNGITATDNAPRPETSAELLLSGPGAAAVKSADGAKIDTPDGNESVRRVTIDFPAESSDDPFSLVSLRFGDETIRVASLSYELAQRTYFVDSKAGTTVVCGPDYAADVTVNGRSVRVEAEAAGLRDYSRSLFARQLPARAFLPSGEVVNLENTSAASRTLLANALSDTDAAYRGAFTPATTADWTWHPADEIEPGFFANKWRFSLAPAPLGSDGDISAYAWYRSTVRVKKAGQYTLVFSDAGDWLSTFVNGVFAGSTEVRQRFDKATPRSIAVKLNAGNNTLAVLTAHYGRHKLFNYVGAIDRIDAKGLAGTVYLTDQPVASTAITDWRWKSAPNAQAADGPLSPAVETQGPEWASARIGQDVFEKKRGFAWYRTLLPAVAGPHRALHFDGVDDNATVFLNGKRLAYHKGWNEAFDVTLDTAWRETGPNDLLVLVENTDNSGGIYAPVVLSSNLQAAGTPVTGWRMRGGVEAPTSSSAWQPVPSGGNVGTPAFYRTEFEVHPEGPPHPAHRFLTTGLSRGFVWLNGHNLGRFPEKTPAHGIYLPECWIRAGVNTLVVFDEEGRLPQRAHLAIESDAARLSYTLQSAGAK